MVDFVPSVYVTLQEAIDEIGRHLMPAQWQGPELILLQRGDSAIEEALAIGGAVATGAPIGRLSWAVNYLVSGLFEGDVKAVIAREDGRLRDLPAALWIRPGIRAVFRSGELPTEFCIAVEVHKADTGKRWVCRRSAEHDTSRRATTPADIRGQLQAPSPIAREPLRSLLCRVPRRSAWLASHSRMRPTPAAVFGASARSRRCGLKAAALPPPVR
jgi:hypothetical protein